MYSTILINDIHTQKELNSVLKRIVRRAPFVDILETSSNFVGAEAKVLVKYEQDGLDEPDLTFQFGFHVGTLKRSWERNKKSVEFLFHQGEKDAYEFFWSEYITNETVKNEVVETELATIETVLS